MKRLKIIFLLKKINNPIGLIKINQSIKKIKNRLNII